MCRTIGDLRSLLEVYPDDTPLLRGNGKGYFTVRELWVIEVFIRADGSETEPGRPVIAAPNDDARMAVCL